MYALVEVLPQHLLIRQRVMYVPLVIIVHRALLSHWVVPLERTITSTDKPIVQYALLGKCVIKPT